MSDREELVELAKLAKECRDLQREYFDARRRRPDTIRRAKDAERRLDRRVAEILEPAANPTLF